MFRFLRQSLSNKLSLALACVAIPLLTAAGIWIANHEQESMRAMSEKNGKAIALAGATAYGRMLSEAIAYKALTVDEVMTPKLKELQFADVHVERPRYGASLSRYAASHGFRDLEDSLLGSCGSCLFASAMMLVTITVPVTNQKSGKIAEDATVTRDPVATGPGSGAVSSEVAPVETKTLRGGWVPVTNRKQDKPPVGDATEENAAKDRVESRGGWLYDEQAPVTAAGFTGTTDNPVLVQEYIRKDTGQMLWDIAAPIYIDGKFWGAFRVGLSQRELAVQALDLARRLFVLFGFVVVAVVGSILAITRRMTRPLVLVADFADEASTSGNFDNEFVVRSSDEVGRVCRSVIRLGKSLRYAMQRMPRDDGKRTDTSMVGTIVAVLALSLFGVAPVHAEVQRLSFRSFSTAAAIGPSADMFADRLLRTTTDALGASSGVVLTKIRGVPAVPDDFRGDVVAAVQAGARRGGYDVAYVSGGDLNKVWGFIFNSGVPFGPTWDEFLGFLYEPGPGLALVQEFLARRGVVAFPIGGSSEQLSGYFRLPVGNTAEHPGIGLVGFCEQAWTLRYLPPGGDVIAEACAMMVAAGKSRSNSIRFAQAVPGSGSLTDAAMVDRIQGFEFATPLDDVSQLYGKATPVTAGLRYVHVPGWHQQFLLTWMIVNQDAWDSWTPAQRAVFDVTARANLVSSYATNIAQQGPALRKIIDAKTTLVRWPEPDLVVLKAASRRVLATRGTKQDDDSTQYRKIMDALWKYMSDNYVYWQTR